MSEGIISWEEVNGEYAGGKISGGPGSRRLVFHRTVVVPLEILGRAFVGLWRSGGVGKEGKETGVFLSMRGGGWGVLETEEVILRHSFFPVRKA